MNYIDQILKATETYIKPQGIKILSLVGLFYVSTSVLSAIRSLSRTFLLFGHNLPQRYGSGSWAVITGGAQGIGAAFAEKLGSLGFNIVLIDINEINLAATALTIEAKFPKVKVKTIVCNFGNSWQEGFYDSLLKEIEGLDISILVNNVGTGTPSMPFHRGDESGYLRTMIVNMVPMTILSRRFIPLMLKRTNRSAIINISSITGVAPLAYIPIYSATKAYVDILSRMIEEDVREKIDVISIRPDVVSTALVKKPEIRLEVITPETAVKGILSKVGRTPYAYGHWRHEVKGWLNKNPILYRIFANRLLTTILKRPVISSKSE